MTLVTSTLNSVNVADVGKIEEWMDLKNPFVLFQIRQNRRVFISVP
jgi:hypothetical protein